LQRVNNGAFVSEAAGERRDGLESVKKTHQVAPFGMGPTKPAAAGLGGDIYRIRVSPHSVDALPVPLHRPPSTSTAQDLSH
jgi:hypothetical protein